MLPTKSLLALIPLFLFLSSALVSAQAHDQALQPAAAPASRADTPGCSGGGTEGQNRAHHRGWRYRHRKNTTSSSAAAESTGAEATNTVGLPVSSDAPAAGNDLPVFDSSQTFQQNAAVVSTRTLALSRGRPRTSTVTTRVATTTKPPASSAATSKATSAPPASSASPAPAPAPAAGGPIDAWSKQILAAHNSARASHGAGNLVWAQDLVDAAQKWAAACVWEHGGNSGIVGGAGQNLAAGASSGATASQSGQAIVDMWMAEEKDYNPKSPTYSHFTQVVWKGTTQLGCFQAQCASSKFKTGSGALVFPSMKSVAYTVCNYKKAGNVSGQYGTNVQKNE